MCELHESALVSREVPVVYGLPWFDEAVMEARKKLFPNAMTVVCGGCIPDMRTSEQVFSCPECERARENWKAAHPEWEGWV